MTGIPPQDPGNFCCARRRSSLIDLAMLVAGLAAVTCGSSPTHGQDIGKPCISLPLAGDLEAGAVGVRRTLFGRRSVATYYDGQSDQLMEAARNRPRFEQHSGHPAGKNRGLLVEAPATNHLTNSSFELGLADWNMEGGAVAAEGDVAIHGAKGIRIEGQRGYLLHAEVVPIAAGAKVRGSGFFGALSVYCSTGDGDPKGVIRPVAFGVEGDARGENLVKDYRFVKMGRGKWHRVVGRFKLLRPGVKYLVGFQLLKRGPIVLDAAQFEANCLPWSASSYIPTGKTSAKRAVEFFRVEAADFPVVKGSVTLWHRTTNPFYRTGYIFVHGPFENKDRLYIHGAGAVTLGTKNSRWAKPLMDLPNAGDWHLFAVTWDGQKGMWAKFRWDTPKWLIHKGIR